MGNCLFISDDEDNTETRRTTNNVRNITNNVRNVTVISQSNYVVQRVQPREPYRTISTAQRQRVQSRAPNRTISTAQRQRVQSREPYRPINTAQQQSVETIITDKILLSVGEKHYIGVNLNNTIQIRSENWPDMMHINEKFMKTTQNHLKIIEIKQVINPHARVSYLLRKKEYSIRYGRNNVEEKILFHGTSFNKVSRIAEKNFNWRFHDKANNNIYGKCVQFSPYPMFANKYADKNTQVKYMFASRVLVSATCEGDKFMNFPPMSDEFRKNHYDTSRSADTNVFAKYREDEFYPQYLIAYEDETKKKNNIDQRQIILNKLN